MKNPQPENEHKNIGSGKRSWSDLGPRLVSAFFLLAVTIFMVWAGGIWFSLMVSMVFAGIIREWESMITANPIGPRGMLSMGALALVPIATTLTSFSGGALVMFIGLGVALVGDTKYRFWRMSAHLFLSIVMIALITTRGASITGFFACVFLGSTVWMTDTGAFFAGRQFGGAKLNPEISPAKTWSGAVGGLIAGSLAGLLVWTMATSAPWWIGAAIAATISVAGQFGDLGESAIKRHFRIKDSGDAIPGHGGLMDRLDSLTFGALIVFAIGSIHSGYQMVAHGLFLW